MTVFVVAAIGVAVVLIGILGLRIHPFLALTLAALTVLVLTPSKSLILNDLQDQFLNVKESNSSDAFTVSRVPEERDYLYWPSKAKRPDATKFRLEVVDSGIAKSSGSVTVSAKVATGPDSKSGPPSPLEIKRGDRFIAAEGYEAAVQSIDRTRIGGIAKKLSAGLAGTFQKIGLPIAMAAIIGMCLLESGAAARLVLGLQSLFGPARTSPALMVSGFVLGVPVFFDTVFYLLLPIAKAFGRQRPGFGLLAVMSIIVGATMAHSLVPPTPGPLLVATRMSIPIGTMMLGGTIVGGTAALFGYAYAVFCNRTFAIDLFPTSKSTNAVDSNGPSPTSTSEPSSEDFGASIPLWLAMTPLVIPIGLLSGIEIWKSLSMEGSKATGIFAEASARAGLVELLGDPGFALLLAAIISFVLLRRRLTAKQTVPLMTQAIADAGTILLLTCAGGAFGAALEQLRLAESVTQFSEGLIYPQGILWAAFLLTGMIRVAQGSATIAMITAVGIVAPFVESQQLPFHPVYVALSIGCGSKLMPWMNDSGFWQVSTMTGMTTTQTLKTFSTALTIMGGVGFTMTLLGAWLLPLPLKP
jgi:gluconate:H+ symporter, GntP family